MVALNKLQRKLVRDLLRSKAQFGAVVAIIAIGITVFVGVYESYQNLYLSYQQTYDMLSMGDYWITVDYLPVRAARDIDAIPGVTAEGRIIGEARVDLATESGQRVEARIVSLPGGEHPRVNDVEIQQGSYFANANSRQILLQNQFAEYHKLHPGDSLTLEHEEIKAPFDIAGVAVSPEYLWVAKSAQEPATTPETFGIIYMPYQRTEELFGMTGLVNEIDLIIDDGVNEGRVLAEVKSILEHYGIKRVTSKNERVDVATRKIDVVQGVRTAYLVARDDQTSHELLQSDLNGFQSLSVMFPALFLILAALAIYVLLSRLIESQRILIGLMTALGYTRRQVLVHYMGFALVVGVLGSTAGAVFGHLLAGAMTTYYIGFLRIPTIRIQPQWDVVLVGLLIGTLVPLAAGLLPSWTTTRMRPAEAMRPPAPPAGHRTLIEILLPFIPRLPITFKIPLRNTFRNLRRSLFMATGVMSATAMILVSLSFVDMLDEIWNTQFDVIQDYDARIIFEGVGSESTATYIGHLTGVETAEPTLEQPYRIRYGDEVQDTAIMGMIPNSTMYHLIDEAGAPVDIPDEGILLSTTINNKLHLEVGDTVQLEPIVGTVGETEETVIAIVDEPLGGRAYMKLANAQDLFKLPGAATGAFVRYYGRPSPQLLERIYNLPEVASIESSDALMDFFDESLAFFWAFVGVMLAMSFGLGLAIVFNGVTVNVLERRREIAVMRAVGMGDRQLTSMITVENLGIALFGIALGLPLGYQLASAFITASGQDVESFAFSVIIYPRSYVIAAACSILILLISQAPAIRSVTRMSLPTVTKDWAE